MSTGAPQLRLPPLSQVPTAAWLLYAILVLVQVVIPAANPVLAEVQRDMVLTTQQTALFVAMLGVARLVFDLPAGWIISTFNRRAILLAMTALTAAGCGVYLLAPSFEYLLLARGLTGISTAIATTTIIVWLGDIAPASIRGTLLGLMEAMFAIATIAGATGSGTLATLINWRGSFAFAGACAAVGFVVALRLPAPARLPTRMASGEAPGYTTALRVGGLGFLATMVLAFTVFFTRTGFTYMYVPLFGGNVLRLDPALIGIAQTAGAIVSFGAVAFGGWLGDRLGRRNVSIVAVFVLASAVAFYRFVGDFPTYLLAYVFIGVANLANGIPPALIPDILPAALRGRGTAIYRLVSDIGILAAPLAVGAALDRVGPAATIDLTVAQVLLAGLLLWALFRFSGPIAVRREVAVAKSD